MIGPVPRIGPTRVEKGIGYLLVLTTFQSHGVKAHESRRNAGRIADIVISPLRW